MKVFLENIMNFYFLIKKIINNFKKKKKNFFFFFIIFPYYYALILFFYYYLLHFSGLLYAKSLLNCALNINIIFGHSLFALSIHCFFPLAPNFQLLVLQDHFHLIVI